jgi:hypothetical protein
MAVTTITDKKAAGGIVGGGSPLLDLDALCM